MIYLFIRFLESVSYLGKWFVEHHSYQQFGSFRYRKCLFRCVKHITDISSPLAPP